MTKPIRSFTRSTILEQQYSAPEFPKSGIPLSNRRYSSYSLGRLHVNSFRYVMPGDKISGRVHGEGTFHRIVTPIMSPVNGMQYTLFIPFRPLDRTFKKGMAPTELNYMSNDWSFPLCNTRYLVDQTLRALFNKSHDEVVTDLGRGLFQSFTAVGAQATLSELADNMQETIMSMLYDETYGLVSVPVKNLLTTGSRLCDMADQLYLRDALIDIADYIKTKLGTAERPLQSDMLVGDFMNLYFNTLLTPFVGRYSYYGEFKYPYVRPMDFYRIGNRLGLNGEFPNYGGFLTLFTDKPQNEYALRAMYAIWYERFRNVDYEPVSRTLPDWQEWGSTSIFDMSAGGNLLYLIYRPRPWEQDTFTSAQVDNLSRHVYAPILNRYGKSVAYATEAENNEDTNLIPGSSPIPATGAVQTSSVPNSYHLRYLNQIDGSERLIECQVPSNINDVLSSMDKTFKDVYGLDLNTLRQSQMLERYLKRNYVFGDEYQDRMLAHYNSKVSDMRVNKPEILSRSMDGYEMRQEVSNVSTDETKVGDRTATATLKINGEPYTTFCEEFGIIVSIVTYMPRAMYDGDSPFHSLTKMIHMPLPEFSHNNEEFGRKSEIAGTALLPLGKEEDNNFIFGRYMAYHAWRSIEDEVGGEFLDELQDCTFRRFFGMFSNDTTPKANYFFLHCRPNLQMFANTCFYDMQLYADLIHECYVERVLPTPVETI